MDPTPPLKRWGEDKGEGWDDGANDDDRGSGLSLFLSPCRPHRQMKRYSISRKKCLLHFLRDRFCSLIVQVRDSIPLWHHKKAKRSEEEEILAPEAEIETMTMTKRGRTDGWRHQSRSFWKRKGGGTCCCNGKRKKRKVTIESSRGI